MTRSVDLHERLKRSGGDRRRGVALLPALLPHRYDGATVACKECR